MMCCFGVAVPVLIMRRVLKTSQKLEWQNDRARCGMVQKQHSHQRKGPTGPFINSGVNS